MAHGADFVGSFSRDSAQEPIEEVGIHNCCFRGDTRLTQEWTAAD